MDRNIECNKCGKKIEFLDTFNLYDPEKNNGHKKKYFFRYDSCYNCDERFKVEYLTELGELSGAKYHDYPNYRLEGFKMKDFIVDTVIEQTEYESQIVRLKRRFKLEIHEEDITMVNYCETVVYLS